MAQLLASTQLDKPFEASQILPSIDEVAANVKKISKGVATVNWSIVLKQLETFKKRYAGFASAEDVEKKRREVER